MESVVITAIVCLTFIIFGLINRKLNLRKVEALEKMQETLMNNVDKIDDETLYIMLSKIQDALD